MTTMTHEKYNELQKKMDQLAEEYTDVMADIENEIFYNYYLNFNEFVEEFLEKIQLKTNNGDLLLSYYKKFDQIQISEIYKLINDPIDYEEEFDPFEKFLIKNGFKYEY